MSETIKELENILPPLLFDKAEKAFKESKLTPAQKTKAIKKILELYQKSKFESGEAAGMVAAQSISEPATQMSLVPEERIIVRKGEKVYPVEIGKFVDETMKENKIEKAGREGKTEICDLKQDIFVPSLDKDEKIQWKRIKSCIRHELNGKLIEIKTHSGRKIIATDYHSFVIRKNNEIIPIAGRELKIGDRIPVVKNMPLNCTMQLNIGEVMPTENLVKRGGYVYPYIAHSKPLPEIINLDSSFGWFIGAYLSEGNPTKYYVNISSTEQAFIEKLRNFSNKFNFTFNEFDNNRGFGIGHDFRINSTILSTFMKEAFGKGSDNKKVADFIFNANEKFVCSVLQGYFDGDGNVSVERQMIRASSNSKELLDGIAVLLSRLGIFCTKSFNEKQYNLVIPAGYIFVYNEKIGSSIEKNKIKLEKLCGKIKEKTYDFIDIIPGVSDLLHKTAKKLKMPTRFVNNFTKRQKIGRQTLGRYIQKFETLAYKKGIDIKNEIKIMKRAFNSDVVWDEILEIKEAETKSKYVYDISVDGLETFTTFDGILTHNTMRTYHVAGAAQIQVTLGLPRLVEIFDARSTPSTPSMNIYLKSKYDSKEKALKIATKIREIRLRDAISVSSIDLLDEKIEFELDEKVMKENMVSVDEIAEKVKETAKNSKVTSGKEKISVKPKEFNIKDVQKLRVKLLKTSVKGLKGISHAVISQKDGKWIITTLGSNLAEVLKIEEVDDVRTISNNIHEIQKVLGIEAARTSIINETLATLKQQGLDVDVRHVMMVSDVMTASGAIKAIGRYGIAGTKGSVLARANFEETIKHLTRAAVRGEVDKLESIVENVMINQVVPAGTGMFDIIFKQVEKKKE